MSLDKVSIIIPVYNEAQSLEELFSKLQDVFTHWQRDHEIIFIDDGSTDGSSEILMSLTQRDPAVRLIRFKRNFGQKAGIGAGLEHSRGEIIVILDADLQIDPADIPRLVEKIDEGYDVVSGARKSRPESLWLRRIPSIFTNLVYKWLLKIPNQDVGCGFQAYRRRDTHGINPQSTMYSYTDVFAIWRGAKFTTVPISFYQRRSGESKYSTIALVALFMDVLITFNTLPVGLAVSTIAAILGGGLSIGLIGIYLLGHMTGFSPSIVWPIFAIIIGATSLNMVMFGIINERMNRIDRHIEKEPLYIIDEIIEGKKDTSASQ